MKTPSEILSGGARLRIAAAAGRLGLILALGLLAGCAGNPGAEEPEMAAGASFGPGYPPGSALWGEDERVAYRTAFVTGMQDQREGYRFDDDRGALVRDESERGFYRQGYRHGYYHDQTVRRQERQNQALDSQEPVTGGEAPYR